MEKQILFAGVLLLSLLLAGCLPANGTQEIPSPALQKQSSSKDKNALIIATGDMSGVYFSLGQAMADMYEKYNGAASATQITSASIQNARLTSQKKVELGFASVDVLDRETQKPEDADSRTKLRALTGLYANYVHIVTTEKSGIRSLKDLSGKRISLGSNESGTKLIAERTLLSAGLTKNDIHKYFFSFSQSADALRNGTIDAAFFSSGLPNPEIATLAAQLPITLIPIPKEIVDRLHEQYGFYMERDIPRETYGMKRNIETLAVKNVLLTYRDLPKQEAYELVDTLYTHLPELQQIHPAARDIKLTDAKTGIPLDFHPGAVKYFTEHEIIH
ncbi:TAXI family TRAP transporter solute-binding subunit [Peribacillus cavernae]|uniref:TAXI family TRAP transporter solute-binding subunit n=1 Tax=Peribacillus cavernae TaxID=1674310 RepID=A0A3S0U1X8_9BACI|nr:TAXI family TRAP transporter solute-binding subunit [Peribacillus cavernae]MDQ0219226.1 TRAP transporter TAXI family solute receptor [Peribacillus cavernae]RUQ28559.1 TAXI family TRAP transporter solute-binding subunit [Peribacillus cavernae]